MCIVLTSDCNFINQQGNFQLTQFAVLCFKSKNGSLQLGWLQKNENMVLDYTPLLAYILCTVYTAP